MTEATVSFKCVRVSKDHLACAVVPGAAPNASRRAGLVLSLRGGFEVQSKGGKAKNALPSLLARRGRGRASPRKRFVARKAEAVSEPAVEGAGTDEPSSKAKPLNDTIAGALARAASQSTIHPLDTVKVQMQAGTFGKAALAGSGGVSKFGALVPPSGAAAKIIPSIASLYRGVFGAASGAGIAIGAYFAIYSTTTKLMDVHVKPRLKGKVPPGAIAFAAGAIAAAGGSFVKVPLAVCIRSVQAGVYPNVVNASRSIVRAAGPRGLFVGFLPTFLEDVPDMAVKFACYETLRQLHRKIKKGKPSTAQEDLVLGGFSGSVAAAATTPLDVIKTNMMCSAATRPSVAQACRQVWAQGLGPRAFFTGVGARSLSNGVNTAVFFAFFEAIKAAMERGEEKKRRRLQDAAAGGRGGDLGVSPAAPSSSAMMEVTDFPEGTQQRVPCLGASMSQTAVNQHLGK